MSKQAKSENGLLANAFQGSFWNTKITSANVGKKELWLGYVAGPFGAMLLQSIVNSYFNQYLTDVLGFTASRGLWIASFMVLFPLLSKILDAITNVLMAKVLDNTACRQGKLRPWMILSLPVMVVSLLMLFWIPFSNPAVMAVWIVIAYNLFYSVGYTMWYMSYELSAALSTRNFKQRKNNSMAGQITKNIGTGMISILFPTILTAISGIVGNTRTGYLACMAVMCCVAVPLTFLQYFYTRERITEERRNQYGVDGNTVQEVKVKEASFMTQFKACIKDKYWIMLIILIMLYQVFNAMRGVAQVYYSGWVVNGNAYGEYASIQAKFTMIALSPMGPGLILLLPLFKKFGRTKVIIVGSVFAAVGALSAFVNMGNTGAIYGGTAIYSIGSMAIIYSLFTFIGDCIDHVEYSRGIRVEGFTAAIVGFAEMFSKGIGQALFNLGLSATNYTTPEVVGSFINKKGNEILLYADQTRGATNWINFSYQGSNMITGILFFVLFVFFFKIEKHMPAVQAALENKKRRECEAKGIDYIPQSELEKRERAKQAQEAEENRIQELKAYCQKTGKDFDAENQKVLDKRAAKAAKKAAKKKN
ncbi:MAG: MFS transporter [Lachnospiraceae bacterium]|nr:MFS transporter [Lachnospiraceae bacterium]